MSRKRKRKPARPREARQQPGAADDVPDRSGKPVWWKYALLAGAFVGWIAFLVYCHLAGNWQP